MELPGLNSELSLSSKVCASMFPALNFSVALPMRFSARRTEADTSEKVSFSLLPFTWTEQASTRSLFFAGESAIVLYF